MIRQGMAEFTVGTAGVMVAHLDSVDRIKGEDLWWGGHGVRIPGISRRRLLPWSFLMVA